MFEPQQRTPAFPPGPALYPKIVCAKQRVAFEGHCPNRRWPAIARSLVIFSLVLLSSTVVVAQSPSDSAQPSRPVTAHNTLIQQVRGLVMDAVLQQPIPGATVRIHGPERQTLTDENGAFRFPDVPIGRYGISVSHVGFRGQQLPDFSVVAGKETVLTISLESRVVLEQGVVVRSDSRKNRPLNEMSVVSARAFSVEEATRYAAAVNDPARMAMAYPGVMAADDGQNHIVIRGNAPNGLLWRMEGVEIPNPNHFSSTASSGGGISILSAQLLSNSDFITGAFAAEYGNALSGVFDLRLRKGNNERQEYTVQAGLLGLNVAAEGPFAKGYEGSYLVNYRYSTLQILNKLGVLNDVGSTNFQDLSYHLHLPSRRFGTFSFFGFSGRSTDEVKGVYDSTKWEEVEHREPSKFSSNTYLHGLTHSLLIGPRTHLKSALAYAHTQNGYTESWIDSAYRTLPEYKDQYNHNKITLSSVLNHRWSTRSTIRAGAYLHWMHYDFYRRSRMEPEGQLQDLIQSKGNTQLVQAFAQWRLKATANLTLNAGLHYIRLLYNGSHAVEPRASVQWSTGAKTSLAFGYGLHSQVQPLSMYFVRAEQGGKKVYPNQELGLSRAHHFVASYSRLLQSNLRLKAEVYYQHLFRVPVDTTAGSTFSMLNVKEDIAALPLVNKGKGRNYGVELSLEKYLSREFYYTLSTSLYQSRYTAADGIERNTRFNGDYINTVIFGKDFTRKGGASTFGVNVKMIHAGGYRTTPIDLEASREKGYGVYREAEAYSLQNPDYFRCDLRLSRTWNKKGKTVTLSLDIQNLTARENIYTQAYDTRKGSIINHYQTGLIPVLNYKIEF